MDDNYIISEVLFSCLKKDTNVQNSGEPGGWEVKGLF